MDKLKACPFCGEDAEMVRDNLCGESHCVICPSTKCESSDVFRIEIEAIKAWNTRPIEDVQAKEIERLEARVKELEEHLSSLAGHKWTQIELDAAKYRASELCCRIGICKSADQAHRYREALEKIDKWETDCDNVKFPVCCDVAKQALTEATKLQPGEQDGRD